MVDYEAIGRRIKEQRKSIRKISQEKMAVDLNLYQADISNLEKANSGSGISDLNKLNLIAEYFDIPLEILIFGGHTKMEKYYGNKMVLKEVKRRISKKHTDLLLHITGLENLDNKPIIYDCGPYSIYVFTRGAMFLYNHDEGIRYQNPHIYVVYGDEIIATLSGFATTVIDHVYQPALAELPFIIQFDILDVTDVMRTLNPYWALLQFDEDNEDKYMEPLLKRMDQLREYGDDKFIIYIENIYVREDCRHNGICIMLVELIKKHYEDPIIWLNMEPSSSDRLETDLVPSNPSNYNMYDRPVYTVSEVGQVNTNNAIAEKLGFTVDPDVWHREAQTIDPDGNIEIKTVEIRKCAYYLPKAVREIIQNDDDLVAKGRALQKIKQSGQVDGVMDINSGKVDSYIVYEQTTSTTRSKYFFYGYKENNSSSCIYGLSAKSVIKFGLNDCNIIFITDDYNKIDDQYKEQFEMIKDMLPSNDLIEDSVNEDMIKQAYFNIDYILAEKETNAPTVIEADIHQDGQVMYVQLISGDIGEQYFISSSSILNEINEKGNFGDWPSSVITRFEPEDIPDMEEVTSVMQNVLLEINSKL